MGYDAPSFMEYFLTRFCYYFYPSRRSKKLSAKPAASLDRHCFSSFPQRLSPLGYSVGTPRAPAKRGSHVILSQLLSFFHGPIT